MASEPVTVFIVRLWRESGGGFRAAARRVDREEASLFVEAEALAVYLEEQAGVTAAAKSKSERPP
jgi:hypothetical protein